MTDQKTVGESAERKRYRAEGPDVFYDNPGEVKVAVSKKGAEKPSRFSAKSFKKDIYRELKTEKLIVLCAASEWGGFTEDTLRTYASLRFPDLDSAELMRAADLLYEDGYLQKNSIPDCGEHYSFSEYGKEAFNRKDAGAMIEKQREQGSFEQVLFASDCSHGQARGVLISSVACNRTSFSDFGVTSVNLFESGHSLPSSPTTTLAVNFCFSARKYSQSPLLLNC